MLNRLLISALVVVLFVVGAAVMYPLSIRAQENVTDFDKQNLTVLNEELRKLRDDVRDLQARVAVLEGP